jgi:hypothetical protein
MPKDNKGLSGPFWLLLQGQSRGTNRGTAGPPAPRTPRSYPGCLRNRGGVSTDQRAEIDREFPTPPLLPLSPLFVTEGGPLAIPAAFSGICRRRELLSVHPALNRLVAARERLVTLSPFVTIANLTRQTT